MGSQKTITQADSASSTKPIDYRRREDFAEFYANNVLYQPSAWDLKLVFGELDQSLGENVVVQSCGITVPWRQVKVGIYFLQFHLTAYESAHGRVSVPKGVVREIPTQPPKEVTDKSPDAEKSWKQLRKLYEDFIAANPEAKP